MIAGTKSVLKWKLIEYAFLKCHLFAGEKMLCNVESQSFGPKGDKKCTSASTKGVPKVLELPQDVGGLL